MEGQGKKAAPAIEYSGRGSEESPPIDAQPRQPRNLPDLLRYSTEASGAVAGNARGFPHVTPMPEESKKFLEEALKSMTVDIVEELQKNIRILQKAGAAYEEDDTTEYLEALDSTCDMVCNADIANDFHKIGGFGVLKPCLESGDNKIRSKAAVLVAELCQNNPYCQTKMLEFGLMPHLLLMVETDEDDVVKSKALYAVSCLVRNYEDGFKEFVSTDGFSVLLRALQSEVESLNVKAAFLLSALCQWKPELKDDLVNKGFVEGLITALDTRLKRSSDGHPSCLEHFLTAILDIVKDHTRAKEIARKPELHLKPILDSIIENSEGCDEFIEEYEGARYLVGVIFFGCNGSNEER